jgi:uncharacterized membrane protein
MAGWKSPIIALCGALIASFVGPARAQAQDTTFELAVCNLSDFRGVFFAVKYKREDESWMVDGWYAIPDGGCTFVGTYQRDTIYYYAESMDGASWNGAATDRTAQAECIDRDKWFEQAAGAKECPAGQAMARFRLITAPAELERFTFSLTGKR